MESCSKDGLVWQVWAVMAWKVTLDMVCLGTAVLVGRGAVGLVWHGGVRRGKAVQVCFVRLRCVVLRRGLAVK